MGTRLASLVRPCACVGLALALGACAATERTRRVEPAGFLNDYSQLRPGKGDDALLVYINPEADFSRYDRVMIEPVTIWRGRDSSLSDVPPEDLQRLAGHLEAALRRQLGREYAIVERPGPGTLRIRTAITEARGSRVVLDIASTVLLPLSAIAKLATGTHAFVGRAAIELEILDAVSNERLTAAVDERAGAKTLRGSTDTWNDVEEAYDYWAERLRARLVTFRALDAASREEDAQADPSPPPPSAAPGPTRESV